MKKTQKLVRFTAVAFALVFLGTFVFANLKPNLAVAAPYSKDTIDKRAEAWLFGRAIGLCFKESKLRNGFYQDLIDSGNATSGKWFYDDVVNTGTQNVGTLIGEIVENDPDDGQVECSNAKLVTEALKYLGIDAVDTLCSMGDIFTREHPGPAGKSCTGGSGHFKAKHWKDDNIQDAWNDVFREKYLEGKGIQESLTDGMRYWIASETFRLGCKADFKSIYDGQSVSGDKKYKTPRYNKDTGEIEQWYVETGDGDDLIDTGGNGYFDKDSKQHCSTLEKDLDKLVLAYKKEVEDLKKTNPEITPDSSTPGGATEPTCESEGGALAWFLCSVIGDFLDSTISTLDKWVNNLLFVDGDRYKSDAISQAWGTMRNIALLILVPMMMFMVIGTALNFGPFDPYTVKKALPRMFIATIFIVISLPITQFGVALSNVVGQGIGNIIQYASPIETSSGDPISIGDILVNHSGAAATTAAAGGAVGFAALVVTVSSGTGIFIGLVFSYALITFVGLLIGFTILVLRQVLLIALMVMAPLAILSWIFPGNDKIWGIWKGTFIAMLMAYPIIAILLATGKFVAGLFA